MTAPGTDTTEITLEDIAPPCSYKPCATPSVWVVTWSCSCVHFYCDAHYQLLAEGSRASRGTACDNRHGGMMVTMKSAERL